MSCTSTTKTNDVSDTDSEESYQIRRHPYNTRSSNTNQILQNSYSLKRPRSKQFKPKSKNNKKVVDNCLIEDSSSMDYCFDNNLQTNSKKNEKSLFCSLFLKLFYLFLLGGMGLAVYSHHLMYKNFEKLKEVVNEIKESNKKVEEILIKSETQNGDFSNDVAINRPDFALQSSGGRIVKVEGIPYSSPKSFFGFKICEGEHGPSSMIQPSTSPGECWAFKGHAAKAVIQLIDEVIIDSVTIEHIPKTISPSGTIETAPKDFKIWGLDDLENQKELLGEFKYEKDGATKQIFFIQNESTYYRYVEFEVVSNYGSKEFTCVYRLRIHGKTKRNKQT